MYTHEDGSIMGTKLSYGGETLVLLIIHNEDLYETR